MNKQTAVVVSLETPVWNWVDEDVLFEHEYDTNFLDTDPRFCVMIAKEQGFFLRAKRSQTLVCPNGHPSQLIFYTCLTRVEIKITELPDLKITKLSINASSDSDVVYWRWKRNTNEL